MNCARVERRIDGYRDGELRGRPAAAVAAHLAACPACRERAEEFQALAADLRGLAREPPPAHLASRAVDRWLVDRPRRTRAALTRPALALGAAGLLLLAALRVGLPDRLQSGTHAGALLAAAVPAPPGAGQGAAPPVARETGSTEAPAAPSKEQTGRKVSAGSAVDRPPGLLASRRSAGRSRRTDGRARALRWAGRRAGLRLARRGAGPEGADPRQVLEQWVARGRYHAARGEYGQAAESYQAAFAAAPSPALAFAAGESAEHAGDVAGAVTYYTQLFDATR